MNLRVGHGIDYHRLKRGTGLRLGGVDIDCSLAIVAHSDGDALLHALCDALLGAVALGDIGRHFPDSDERWKGADSRELTREVVAMVHKRGWSVINADLTLVAQKPRVSGQVDEMAAVISGLLSVPFGAVNVKATTTEKMGVIGAGEGIGAHAVVLLQKP